MLKATLKINGKNNFQFFYHISSTLKVLSLFLCITLLLPSPCRSEFGVRFNPQNIAPFWQYDYEKEDNEKSKTLRFNLSKGEWYYFDEKDQLEFHPDTTGMLIVSKVTDSEFIYFQKPRRVLIFPSHKNQKSPYVAESLILSPGYRFNEKDLLFPPIQEGLDVNNAMKNLQEGERLPRQEDAKGDGIKLNQTMNANQDIIKRIWGDEYVADQKLEQYNKKMPIFDFVDESVNFGVGYSNHGSLLFNLQEKMLEHVNSSGQMPTNLSSNGGVLNKFSRLENEFMWRLFPYMFTTESYFLFSGPRGLNEQNLLIKKFRPSAILLLNQIKDNPNVYSDDIKEKFDKVRELLVNIADQVTQEFVFKSDQFFSNFFKDFDSIKSIEEVLKVNDHIRSQEFLTDNMTNYHWLVLTPLGYNQNDHNIKVDHREFRDPNVVKMVEEIKDLMIEIFTGFYDGYSELVKNLDESLGEPILEKELEALKKVRNPRDPIIHYTEVMMNARKDNKFNKTDKEGNIKAFASINFHELVYNWLNSFIVGQLLTIYENAFFKDIYSMHALQKMKLVKKGKNEMKPDAQMWFVRNLMIFGLIDYNEKLVNETVQKFDEDFEFFELKKSDKLTPELWRLRLLVV